MDSPKCCCFLVYIFLLILITCNSPIQAEEASLHLQTDSLEWPMAMSLYDDDGLSSTTTTMRSLFWHRVKYYISYGALSANRIPCPPRSGRSYYTHNCHFASGPVHPYSRGCSAITRCRR